MDRSNPPRRCGSWAVVLAAVASWLTFGAGAANGQVLANAVINGLEMTPAGSLEQEIVNRLSWTGQYDPRDLARLARLTVLETIAMYQNTRADLRATGTGARLEGEMSLLWTSAELFSVSASGPVQEPGTLDRSRALLVNMDRALQQVSARLSELPGVPGRALDHLQNVARLVPLMNNLIETIDADLNAPPPAPMAAQSSMAAARAALREHSRKLVEAPGGLIETVKAAPTTADRADLIAALERLLELTRGFDRFWDANADEHLLATAFRPVREQVRRIGPSIETWSEHANNGADSGAQWREFHRHFEAVSDGLGFSRVIVGAARGPSGTPRPTSERVRARSPDHSDLLARIDRTVGALSALISRDEAGPGGTIATAETTAIAARARLELLVVRQSALNGAPTEALARSLADIERSRVRLRALAGADRRVVRGINKAVSPELQRAAEELGRLLDAISPRPVF